MIHSEQRSLLTDALTPPSGYVFEAGVATTFSLDLVTLLTLPLHLAWLGSGEGEGGVLNELPVFEALRRTAERLTVFCHAGRMSIPRIASPLLALLEEVVHEALPRHQGAFHPKVWLLKFVGTLPNQTPRLRLLVLSRNLTDDRSWDLSLSLDGLVGTAKVPNNQPLTDFLQHTQTLSRRAVSSQRQSDIAMLARDVGRCVWELPPGFTEIRFHALGIARTPQEWLPKPDHHRWDELGVISPFVSELALERLAALSPVPLFLLCRADEMDGLCEGAERKFQSTHVLSTRAEAGDEEEVTAGDGLSGLHAKAFIGKRGWDTHLFIGSANATDAALLRGRNVEFMAELVGRVSSVRRPSDWLSEDGLGSYLEPYVRSLPMETASEKAIADKLESVRKLLVEAPLYLRCTPEEDRWQLSLECSASDLHWEGVEVQVWPLSLDQGKATIWPIHAKTPAVRFPLLSEHDITTFTGFRLTMKDQELTFGLNLPAEGLPEGRDLAILRSALRNRDGFVRYLLLLLGSWEQQADITSGDAPGQGHSWQMAGSIDVPLFEMLARAYSRDPARLVQIGQILKKLQSESSENEDIVPAEFRAIWQSFEVAMQDDVKP